MNIDQQNRQHSFVRATRRGMVRPSPLVTTAHAKVLYRRLRHAYARTHKLLGRACFEFTCTSQFLIQAVDNECRAQALLREARTMPRTNVGMCVREVALDNADVAHGLLKCLASTLNRAPALN